MELRVLRHTDCFDEACRFWGEIIGWPVTHSWPADEGQGRGCLFGYGDVARIEFVEVEEAGVVHGVVLAVEVDDVVSLRNGLVDHGLELVRDLADQPWGHRNVTVLDPTGIPVTFFQIL
jgi:hypothetical protein